MSQFGLIGGIVQSAASHINAGINYHAQRKFNKQAREWQLEDYNTQRRDSLADWNMVNQYNAPAAQMERYKAAGLNPNLIYGQSNESGAVRATTMGSNNAEAPQFIDRNTPDWGNLLMNLESREINNENARKQGVLLTMEANKRAAEIVNIWSNTDKTKAQTLGINLDNQLKDWIMPAQVEAATLNNQRTKSEIAQTDEQTKRITQQIGIDMREIQNKERSTEIQFKNYLLNVKRVALERIRTESYKAKNDADIKRVEQMTRNLEKTFDILTSEDIIKHWHAELAKQGINPNDNIVERQIAEIIESGEITGVGAWEVIKSIIFGSKKPKPFKGTKSERVKQGNKTTTTTTPIP